MKPQLTRKINGSWQRLRRDRHLLAKQYSMDDSEYRLWDLLVASYDWDKKHNETYGTVITTDMELASFLGWSDSKVCRVRHRLLGKKIIVQLETGLYSIPSIPLPQEHIASMQEAPALLQESHASMQSLAEKNRQNSIVSYKDRFSITSPVDIPQQYEVEKKAEYEKIYRSGGYVYLTSSDMEFLDSPEYLNNISWCQPSLKPDRSQVSVEDLSLYEIREALCPT